MMPASPAHDDRGGRSFWTVGRKVIAAVAAAVTLGFVSIVTVDIVDRRDDAWSSAIESNLAVANLLAAQMSGGVRWKKADVVAATYADLVAAPGSTVASITATTSADSAIRACFTSRGRCVRLTPSSAIKTKSTALAAMRWAMRAASCAVVASAMWARLP